MPITVNFDDITPLLTDNTIILTPNSRTQKALIGGYMESMTVGDVVRAPEIISISQWVEQLWQSLSFNQTMPLIVADLELKTWLKELITTDPKWQLTNVLGVAEKVLEAYRNLILWDKELSDLINLETAESHYFMKWAILLEEFLEKNNLVARFSMIKTLLNCDLIETYFPQQLILVGFNQLNPLETSFLELCKTQGTSVQIIKPKKFKASISKVEAIDLQQELKIAASRSKQLSNEKPDISIGIVVQQLSSHLSLIHQVFSECFQPQELLPWQPLEKSLYNISAGQPLAEIPMIITAIQLLKLKSTGFDLRTLAFLKNSPFIFWGNNEGSIKRFIHEQSLLAFSHYSLTYLINAAEKEPEPELLELFINRIHALKNTEQYARPMQAWTDSWKSLLTSWGWLEMTQHEKSVLNVAPVNKQINDDFDTKVKSEFLAALKDSLSVNHINKKLTNSQAKDYLFQVLRQKVFQIPSDRTNIQILGVLEAAGLEFDELIMVGFNRDNWPQKHKINPFIPFTFQQENDMPGSSASREYEYAKDLSDSLLSSANTILITHSNSSGDELSSESALFKEFPASEFQLDTLLNATESVQANYQWVKDENIDLSSTNIKGGAYLLSQYATCPFRAMSSFQLKIKSAEFPHKGIEPRIKGAWLHLVMELLWKKLKNQTALLELSEQALQILVNQNILKAKLEFDAQLKATTSDEIVAIEIDKMKSQIMEWMQLDKQREPFAVTPELDKELKLGKLKFNFRIDRVDTNLKAEIDIIDYKTGSIDVKKWLGKRPEEAQMPAYVLACHNESINSLSYAKIKTGEVLSSGVWFEGKSKNGFRFIDRNIDGIKDRTKYILSNNQLIDLEQTLPQQWRKNLEELSNKIVDGEMPVSPKNKIESCRYCEFEDFCRIGERQPDEELQNIRDNHSLEGAASQ